MQIQSKFNKLYITRHAFFALLGVVALLACSINYFNENFELKQRNAMLTVGLFTLAVCVGALLDAYSMYRVVLDDEKIIAQYLFKGKKEIFYYKDIASLSCHGTKRYIIKGVPLTDGYRSNIYKMEDGRMLEISPEAFENHQQLTLAINQHTPNLE